MKIMNVWFPLVWTLCLLTRTEDHILHFLQQKIYLTFCNIQVFSHSLLHSLIHQIWWLLHTCHMHNEKCSSGSQWSRARADFHNQKAGKANWILLWAGQNCLDYLDNYYLLFFIMRDLASRCYLAKISNIFIKLR